MQHTTQKQGKRMGRGKGKILSFGFNYPKSFKLLELQLPSNSLVLTNSINNNYSESNVSYSHLYFSDLFYSNFLKTFSKIILKYPFLSFRVYL